MATPTRIYHINLEGIPYLVRAAHPSAALMHVARNVASVRVASQDDLVNCIADGIKVENAREEAPEPAPAAPPAEEKSLPLWPMPTPRSTPEPFTLSDPMRAPLPEPEGDEDDEEESRPAQDGQVAGGIPQRQRMPIKYRCPQTGSTWSGRGMKPIWLRTALDAGAQLSAFEVAAQA